MVALCRKAALFVLDLRRVSSQPPKNGKMNGKNRIVDATGRGEVGKIVRS
jgi:hypothetical protein